MKKQLNNDGIQGFSKPQENMVIWAADNDHKPHEVRGYLSSLGIQFTPMLGSYIMASGQRVVEFSYCTNEPDFMRVQDLWKGQESVLRLSSKDSRNRFKAELCFCNAIKYIDLGRMFSVPVLDAPQWGHAWSIPLDGSRNGAIVAFVCAQVDKFGEAIKP